MKIKCSVYEQKFDYVNGGGISQKAIFKENALSNDIFLIITDELEKAGYSCFHLNRGLIQMKGNYKITLEDFFKPIEKVFRKVGIELVPTFYGSTRFDGGATSLM